MPNANLNPSNALTVCSNALKEHSNTLTEREEQALKSILHSCSDISYSIETLNFHPIIDILSKSKLECSELVNDTIQLLYFIGHYSLEVNSVHNKLKSKNILENEPNTE